VRVAPRKKFILLEIWIRDNEENIKLRIGEKLRVLLDLSPQNLTFFF
jgi:translation initiation factor 4E